ncbi:MAG TPA: hypothetical protein VL527_11045 [Dongiaceae bacterium]|nr:hypothetical protein [Dongiaceae bacterium]
MLTPDGRYVLFVSLADNLTASISSTPASFPAVPHWNVYRHDRQTGANLLVSAASSGAGGNGDSLQCAISTNGTRAVFASAADDLIAGDTNGVVDIFQRSLTTGVTAPVSVSTNGGWADGPSRDPVMTPDGRYVAFVSAADNLVAGDTNGVEDVFVRDLITGVTRLAGVGAIFSWPVFDSLSTGPKISDNGRYVAFFSMANDLVAGATNRYEVYVRDMVANQTYCASGGAHQLLSDRLGATAGVYYNLTLSADGLYVAFEGSPVSSTHPYQGIIARYSLQSGVTDLVSSNSYGQYWGKILAVPEMLPNLAMTPNGRYVAFVANANATTTGNNTCVQVWDGQTQTLTLASGGTNGTVISSAQCLLPDIDSTGRYVTFLCNAANLTTNATSGGYELYCRDLQQKRTWLISTDVNGGGAGMDGFTSARLAGNVIAFDSAGPNIVAADANQAADVFVRSLTTNTVELISARDPDRPAQALGAAGPDFAMSADGRYVAFASDVDGLVPGDTNGVRDIYVRDLAADTITLVSASTNGVTGGNAPSTGPVISGNGRYVAFSSLATDLAPGDADGLQDVFLRDLVSATTVNASGKVAGTASYDFYGPQLDATGKYLLFFKNTSPGLYRYDLLAAVVTNFLSSAPAGAITPDSHFLAFFASSYLNILDTQSNSVAWKKSISTPTWIGLSPDGSRVAYVVGTSLYGADRILGNSWTIATGIKMMPSGPRFSGDGHFLTYASTAAVVAGDTNQLADVYLFDFAAGTGTCVSLNPGLGVANGGSDSPDISPDGRYVVFRSAASNLVADDTNGLPDIFMWDRSTGNISCLSRQPSGGLADNRSFAAKFVGDGRSLVFVSAAQNLTANDSNQANDLFAYNFLYAQILSASLPPTVGWTVPAGLDCHVEFSDSLNPPHWQAVTNEVLINGDQARVTDTAPATGQRWYRVVGQ